MSRRFPRDTNRKPWFWGFVGKTALATVIAVVTLWVMGLISLLLFGGAMLGLLGMNTDSEPEATEQTAPSDFPTFSDTETAPTDTAIGPPPEQSVPVVLSATSDVPAEVSWQIGNEKATETFTGEWTMEGTADPTAYETVSVDITPVDYAASTTTCTITVDGTEADAGTATNDTAGTSCYA